MKKIKEWNPEYIKELASRMEDSLDALYDDAPLEYVDSKGIVSLDEQNNFEARLESLLEDDGLSGIITDDYESLAELVWDAMDKDYWDRKEDELRQIYVDTVEYNRNPLAYYGMTEKVFL